MGSVLWDAQGSLGQSRSSDVFRDTAEAARRLRENSPQTEGKTMTNTTSEERNAQFETEIRNLDIDAMRAAAASVTGEPTYAADVPKLLDIIESLLATSRS